MRLWSIEEAPDRHLVTRWARKCSLSRQHRWVSGNFCSHPQLSIHTSFIPHLKDVCSEKHGTSLLFCLSVDELSFNGNNYHYVGYFSHCWGKTLDKLKRKRFGLRFRGKWGEESVCHCHEAMAGEEAEKANVGIWLAVSFSLLLDRGTSCSEGFATYIQSMSSLSDSPFCKWNKYAAQI